MKIDDLRKLDNQKKLLETLVLWEIELNDFKSIPELLSSSDAFNFIKNQISSNDSTTKLTIASKLQEGFISRYNTNMMFHNIIDEKFKSFCYAKAKDPQQFSLDLPRLSPEDVNQPDVLNKLLCEQFSDIKSTDWCLFLCAGRGSDALYVCNTYNVPKDHCYLIEIDSRLCKRLRSLGFKNVIEGNILLESTWTKLYNIIKEPENMKPNRVLLNPPYNGSLHLEVLSTSLTHVRAINPEAELVSIQPARWIEDPLAELKQGTDFKKYKETIVNKISNLQLITMKDACGAFNIGFNGDLGIYTFKSKTSDIIIYSEQAQHIIDKVLIGLNKLPRFKSEFLSLDENKSDGYRLRVNPVTGQAAKNKDDITATQTPIRWCVFNKLYHNGVNIETGNYWTDERKKSGNYKPDGSPLPWSIKLPDMPEDYLLNCAKSFGTHFIWNWLYLIKLDQNTPLNYIPYMNDYSHVWTSEDYCKFFDLNEEETKFMCREIEDYRIKDFINYIKLPEV